jgi:1,2-dihydroxy-3-keto-5-methylthiopentene dioxygenase
MSDQINDQREECQREPPVQISLSELTKLGIEYFHVGTKNIRVGFSLPSKIPVEQSTKGLDEISHSRGYNYRDEIVVNRERLPNYDSRIKQFFEEHLHTDEEVRYILEGAGYFDVRTADDEQWIRILTEPGDLVCFC